jgi:methionine sulfoxide reductase heme-binding subunit
MAPLAASSPSLLHLTSAFPRLLAITTAAAADPTMWYATRAAAVCAYIALTLTVLLGILRSLMRVTRFRKTWLIEEIHQYVADAAAVFIAVHLTTLLLDPLIPFSPLNLLLPIAEPYRPLAVALGVFALYTVALVIGSSWLRRHLPYSAWRILHYGSFVAFWLVTLHGILAGSDAGEAWMRTLYIVAAVMVSGGMALRAFWPAQTPASTVPREYRPYR